MTKVAMQLQLLMLWERCMKLGDYRISQNMCAFFFHLHFSFAVFLLPGNCTFRSELLALIPFNRTKSGLSMILHDRLFLPRLWFREWVKKYWLTLFTIMITVTPFSSYKYAYLHAIAFIHILQILKRIRHIPNAMDFSTLLNITVNYNFSFFLPLSYAYAHASAHAYAHTTHDIQA